MRRLALNRGHRVMLSRLFSAPARRAAVVSLFDVLNAAARNPALYGPDGAADTPDGRFEVLALFSAALFADLAQRGEEAVELGQGVFDRMFRTFDQGLRDLGVGDVHVGPRIKKLSESFYGRLGVYRAPVEARDAAALALAIAPHVFTRTEPAAGEALLAAAVLDWSARLAATPQRDLMAGRVGTRPA